MINNNKYPPLVSIIDKDINLKNWILRNIVLKQIDLQFSNGVYLRGSFIKNYVEYENNEIKDKIKPITNRADFYIISSLNFVLNDELKKEITNINHDDFSNKNKLTKPILVKTITIDNGINISEILNNIKFTWNSGLNKNVKELHIYLIINETLYSKKYIIQTNEFNCKDLTKIIYLHTLSSTYFFNPQYLDSFYNIAGKDKQKDNSALNRETDSRMNIFIFNGFEWGILKIYFELLGYTLNSGTTSLRHKENLVGYRVSKFICWSGLDETKINFGLNNRYFERYIDDKTFENEILSNYKSKIFNPNLIKEFPSNFLSLYSEREKNKVYNNLLGILNLNKKIIDTENDINKINGNLDELNKNPGLINWEYINTLDSAENQSRYKYLWDIINSVSDEADEDLNYKYLILSLNKRLNLKNATLKVLFKDKIKSLINIYAINNWENKLHLIITDYENYYKKLSYYYPDINSSINEIKIFYQEFVEYISTLDLSGKIKTKSEPSKPAKSVKSAKPVKVAAKYATGSRYKVLSKQDKNISGKDKRQLHTLINYYNKSICLVSNGSGFFFLSVVVPSLRDQRSYSSLVTGTRNNLDIREVIKNKTKIKTFNVPFNKLNEFEFIKLLQLNLNLNTDYTILFQYTLLEKNIDLMLGPQEGIAMRETHDFKKYRKLYEHFIEKLEIIMQRYGVVNPDLIVIYLKEVILEETLKKDNPISKIVLRKGLVKVGETKRLFISSILPITYNEKYFGYLLQDKLKIEYLSKIIKQMQSSLGSELSCTGSRNIQTSGVLQLPAPDIGSSHSSSIKESVARGVDQGSYDFFNNIDFNNFIVGLNTEQNQILFLQEVLSATPCPQDTQPKGESVGGAVRKGYDLFKVYLSRDSKYLIFSIMSPDFVYYRIVFNNKTDKFLFVSKDILNPELINKSNFILNPAKSWIRNIGNTSIVLDQNNNIVSFIRNNPLKAIKYKDHKKLINLYENKGRVSAKQNSKSASPQVMTNPNYGVFDIETFIDTDDALHSSNAKVQSKDGYSRVYALGFVTLEGLKQNKDSTDLTLYYLTDHFPNTVDGSAKLVLMCIDNMLVPKYNKFIFYVHNLGRFDVIFLHKILLDYNLTVKDKYILDPLYRDNQIIRLIVKLKNNKKEIKIAFVDSLNLLSSSLAQLCIDYDVKTVKGLFPYLFVNKDNLLYVGQKPDIKFYNKDIDLSVYNSIPSGQWDLRAETLKYLGKDLNSLLEILCKFQTHLWVDHNIEMTEGLTISSLAKNKFFKYYLKDSKIPLINTNTLFNFIYSAYYGGITEVYKPYGQDLTYLDVNSLYPFAALNPMAGLECQWIESYGDQELDLDKLFGVFHAEVVTNDLYIGLLPLRTKTGILFPNGKFDGTWTSVELQFAKKYGYQIKVTKGFQFNKEFNVFDNYVNELSKLKDELKGSQRQVVKSLLNNLLGRFALNFVKSITKTVNKSKLDKILSTKEVKTFKQINEDNFIVTFVPVINRDICESHGLDYYKVTLNERKQNIVGKVDVFHDTSIIVSAFTTAYARIHMHQIKLIILANGGNIYYSDTDSIATDLPLNKLKEIMAQLIGDKLGQLKFEHNVSEAFFISNKTYALVVEDGKEILKAKGVTSNSLSLQDFKDMYLKSKSIQGDKTSSIISYSKGSVSIKASKININWNSYTKREKIYNPTTNLWTDTRPLYIDNLTRSITVYIPKNIIKFTSYTKPKVFIEEPTMIPKNTVTPYSGYGPYADYEYICGIGNTEAL